MTERKRILIADDDPIVRLTIRKALEKMTGGHQIEAVPDGVQALERLRSGEYDLLISDIRMPGLDGVDLVETIRRQNIHTAVIWITAYQRSDLEAQRQRLQVTFLLHKPLRIDKIRRAAQTALSKNPPHRIS